MGKRFDTLLFPGGKRKVFTLSYDDGVVQDRRLAALIRSYGAKATFNLNSALLGKADMGSYPGKPLLDISKVAPEELETVYAGHEIAGHGLYHSDLAGVGAPRASYEIVEDKRRLEALSGQPLRMFAYPFGTFSDEVKEALRLAGYHGARTVLDRAAGGVNGSPGAFGWTGGYGSWCEADPEDGTAFVYMHNLVPNRERYYHPRVRAACYGLIE